MLSASRDGEIKICQPTPKIFRKQKMKNRITELFKTKKENILSIFFTAGYPAIYDTTKIIALIEKSGADIIEIGIPFSDPLADGIIIQKSSEQSLKNGMSINLLFHQLEDIRKTIKIPIVLMGYLNPVIQYGMKSFVEKCKKVGVDGVIIPDLPIEEYKKQYQKIFEQNQVSTIFMITPDTGSERIRKIDNVSSGFIYLVSSSSTTGQTTKIDSQKFTAIKKLKLNNPLLVGFGISDKEKFQRVCKYSNGAIIGSAFIKKISDGKLETTIPQFISSILN